MKDIIKELRRSAMEDADPYSECKSGAWIWALNWRGKGCSIWDLRRQDLRTFLLLVAEALERP